MVGVIQKMYKDRYRKVYCDEKFYRNHQNLFKMWKTRFALLSNVEKVQAWVIGLSCLRRPQDWYGGQRQKIFLDSTANFLHPLCLIQLFKDTPVCLPPKLNPEMNLLDFINVVKIKAFPESCNRSLCFIANHHYPLLINEKIPTPSELLQIQISGKRIITFNENHSTWPDIFFSGRDFLGFIMHDLIHADHFFYNPEHRRGQLGFFNFIKNILSDQRLVDLLRSNTFKTGFEYIISDMNSHPVHLFQTLKNLLFSELKNDVVANVCWQNWVSKSPLQATESHAINAINTANFNTLTAQTIEKLCFRLGNNY